MVEKSKMSRENKSESRSSPIREPGQFAYGGLQRVIHERARLSILSSLAAHPEGLLFNDLKALCDLTDGNLSRQLSALQSAQLVEVWKGTKNRRPQTLCRLTTIGRKRFVEYISELERVVQNAQAAGLDDAGASSLHRLAGLRPKPAGG
jgi:DNA-binding MarR family transcriptional regulator